MKLTVGSFCSGIDGLALGVERALGVETAWHAEVDKHASIVLAHRWPDVPNLGDLRAVDWSQVEPVDVLVAGFPCQPVSTAGRRAGTDDERWLFDDIAEAVGRMEPRPRLLLFENVAGLLSANGGGAMARVVHGLAALGYVGRWRTLRSSDAGAPHRRERVFLAAADAERGPAQLRRGHRGPGGQERQAGQPSRRLEAATHPTHERGDGTAAARRWWAEPAGSGEPAPDTDGGRLEGSPQLDSQAQPPTPDRRSRRQHADRRCDVAWGAYEPAIRRWEATHGPAPGPVDDRGRLSPRFVEWMLGFPAGWVTDLDLPRTAQLRLLGNSVQPQVAELAARLLLAPALEAAA